jgi:hypothetical protein
MEGEEEGKARSGRGRLGREEGWEGRRKAGKVGGRLGR